MNFLVPYHTHMQQRTFAGKVFVLETIRDIDEAIEQVCEEKGADPFAEDLCPYFGMLWPAAEALAQFLVDHPQMIQGKKVLELGCGLGVPSLVAAHLGAKVLATDYHPDVEGFLARNCRHSSVEVPYQRLNWRAAEAGLIGQFEVVMGSDVLYESKHAGEVAAGLIRFMAPGGKILLSDPGRNYVRAFLESMDAAGFKCRAHGETQFKVYEFSI